MMMPFGWMIGLGGSTPRILNFENGNLLILSRSLKGEGPSLTETSRHPKSDGGGISSPGGCEMTVWRLKAPNFIACSATRRSTGVSLSS
jgi:hypothetical protein